MERLARRVDSDARRSLILSEAKKLFVEEGFENTSIRKIAAKIKYSPASIYLYFEDKDEILNSIMVDGLSRLEREFEVAMHSGNPLDKIKSILSSYMRFAMNNKEVYRLLCMNITDVSAANELIQNYLKKAVDEGIKLKAIRRKDAQEIVYFLWSSVHGMSMLLINGHINLEESKIPSLQQKTIMTLSSYLEKHSLLS